MYITACVFVVLVILLSFTNAQCPAWAEGNATTTRYWDCNTPYCEPTISNQAYPAQYAMFVPTDGGVVTVNGKAYQCTYYGTAAASDVLLAPPSGNNVNTNCPGCESCYLVQKVGDSTGPLVVVKANNWCPGQYNSVCLNAPHFDLAVPGFDWDGTSVSNVCSQRTANYTWGPAGSQACTNWYYVSDSNEGTCNCSSISSNVLLQNGCSNFLSLKWDNPTVYYAKLDSCPPNLSGAPLQYGGSVASSSAAPTPVSTPVPTPSTPPPSTSSSAVSTPTSSPTPSPSSPSGSASSAVVWGQSCASQGISDATSSNDWWIQIDGLNANSAAGGVCPNGVEYALEWTPSDGNAWTASPGASCPANRAVRYTDSNGNRNCCFLDATNVCGTQAASADSVTDQTYSSSGSSAMSVGMMAGVVVATILGLVVVVVVIVYLVGARRSSNKEERV